MIKKFSNIILLVIVFSVFVFCASEGQATSLVQTTGQGKIDWTEGIIKVKGTGAAPANMPAGQARLMAKRAAIADGYRNLAEIINGVQVTSQTTVKNFVTESDVIYTKVEGFIKGAQVLSEKTNKDGTVEVTLAVQLMGDGSLGAILLPEVQTEPAPPISTEETEESSEQYTGLIIDARGTKIKPCLSPKVEDEEVARVYDAGFVSPEVLPVKGVVTYVKTDTQQQSFEMDKFFYAVAMHGMTDAPFFAFGFKRYGDSFQTASVWGELKKGFKKITKLVERVGENPLVLSALTGGSGVGATILDMLVSKKNKKDVEMARKAYDFLKDGNVAVVLGEKLKSIKTGWAR